jgi:hypothetical protein
MPESTFYSIAAGDGDVSNDDASWATCHDAATGDQARPGNATSFAQGRLSGTYKCQRLFHPFDTSSIADTSTVDSAIYSAFANGTTIANVDSTDLRVVETSQASSTTLVTADYDAQTLTLLASAVLFSAISTDAYIDMTLNATGEGVIDFSGVTFLGLMVGTDYLDSTPTGDNTLEIYNSNESGVAKDPKLVITWSHGAGEATLTDYDGGVSDTNNFGTTQQYRAQGFQIPANASCTGFGIRGTKGTALSATDFVVEIRSGSDPDDTLVKTETFDISLLPDFENPPFFTYLNWTTPVDLVTGTQYYLKLQVGTGASDAGDELRWSSDDTSPTYSDGTAWVGPSSTQQSGKDQNFAIFGIGAATGLPGSLSLLGVGQ